MPPSPRRCIINNILIASPNFCNTSALQVNLITRDERIRNLIHAPRDYSPHTQYALLPNNNELALSREKWAGLGGDALAPRSLVDHSIEGRDRRFDEGLTSALSVLTVTTYSSRPVYRTCGSMFGLVL